MAKGTAAASHMAGGPGGAIFCTSRVEDMWDIAECPTQVHFFFQNERCDRPKICLIIF